MSLTIKVALEAVMLNNLLFQANKKVTRAHVRYVRDLICVLMKKNMPKQQSSRGVLLV